MPAPPLARSASIQIQSIREEAQKIFRDYSLSPADTAEAIRRYVRTALESEKHLSSPTLTTGELAFRVLYSMDAEDVLRYSKPISIEADR